MSTIFLISVCIYLLVILKQKENKIKNFKKDESELLNLINNTPIAAFLKDTDNNIISANHEFFKLFNLNSNCSYYDLSGIIYSGLNLDDVKNEDNQLINTGRTVVSEKFFINSRCKIYKTPIYDSDNNISKIAVFIKSVNDEISGENNKDIIATLTHDLKNPAVAQIRGIELLLKGNFGEINDTQRSFLTDILSSCNNMLDMLVNMLWLYKFDNKRVAVNITSFDVNELIKDIFNENKLLLSEKNHNFKQNNKTAKIHILADKMHIKRIICNLLTNAVTHSRENSTIYIETNVVNNNFIFKVTNEGEYLPEDLLKCIFDKNKVFNQKSDGLSTGLGLYLSNSLLELNGGKFLYSSNPNGYNTFGFTLNLSPARTMIADNSIKVGK